MLPFESAPVTDPYCMTTRQDFETTVLTLSFWEGHGKQLVSPRKKKNKKKNQTTSSAKEKESRPGRL